MIHSEKHIYDIECAFLYLDLVERVLNLRARDSSVERDLLVTDEETTSTFSTIQPLITFSAGALDQSDFQHSRERALAFKYAELAFSDVYFGWFDRKYAIEIIFGKVHPSDEELDLIWDKVEPLIDDWFDDFQSGIFKEQKREISLEIFDYIRKANN